MMKYLVLFSLIFLISCGQKESLAPTPKDSIQENEYQIGDHWSLKTPARSENVYKSVFKIRSEFSRTQGIASYLGKVDSRYVFITSSHVVSDALDLCDSFVNIYENKTNLFVCDGVIVGFKDLDISIITMKSTKNMPDDRLKNLKPLSFSYKAPRKGERLKLVTLSNDYQPLVDQSSDCTFLQNNIKLKSDIDRKAPLPTSSWSLPVGCEARHGDSGAPILNEEGELVALIWTGKTPKSFVSTASLNNLMRANSTRLWTDFNLAVPMMALYDSILPDYIDVSQLYKIWNWDTQEMLKDLLDE